MTDDIDLNQIMKLKETEPFNQEDMQRLLNLEIEEQGYVIDRKARPHERSAANKRLRDLLDNPGDDPTDTEDYTHESESEDSDPEMELLRELKRAQRLFQTSKIRQESIRRGVKIDFYGLLEGRMDLKPTKEEVIVVDLDEYKQPRLYDELPKLPPRKYTTMFSVKNFHIRKVYNVKKPLIPYKKKT